MSNPVPTCTHVKTNGEVCGSPAVSGAALCYHHSAVKTALGKAQPKDKASHGEFAPIGFIFPEDRASMQINFFLLLQAYNEQRIDQRTYNSMVSLLKAMARNLGKTGSLVEKPSDQNSAPSDQDGGPTPGSPRTGLRSWGGHKPASGPSEGHELKVRENSEKSVSKSDGLESLLDLKASAIAPESCFSKKLSVGDTNVDLFRVSTLDLAGYGFHQAAQPLSRAHCD